MQRVNNLFNSFILNSLKILMTIIVVVSAGTAIFTIRGIDKNLIIVLAVYIVAIIGSYFTIKSNLENKYKVLILLGVAAALRGLWLLNVDSIPVSDFKTMYNTANKVLVGDFNDFKGTSYFARFPHLTAMILYMAGMIKLFSANLLAMKIVNLLLGVATVGLIYLIIKEVFHVKQYALIGGFIAALYPSLITYTGVFCGENIAIPFYLLSIWVFILATKNKNRWPLFLVSGIALGIGNLFRMVAMVTLIAYVMYLLIYDNEKIVYKLRNSLLIIVGFFIILTSVSSLLMNMGITENALNKGIEPKVSNILKGTNIQSGGRWSPEDAAIPELYNYDYEKIEEACNEIIKERLTTTPPQTLIRFYIQKFAMQWNESDLGGGFWSQLDVQEGGIIVDTEGFAKGVYQIFYVAVLILALIGLFNKKYISSNKHMYFFYIMFGGYILAYLITESQSRYAYIVGWIFIILCIPGVDLLMKIRKSKGQQ